MSVTIPTMSMAGWIATPHEKAAYMIVCFMTAQYSQSELAYGKITTLQYLVKQYAGDMIGLGDAIRAAFEAKAESMFPGQAVVDVEVIPTDPDNPTVYTIRLICEITENGITQSIGRLVMFKDSIMVKFEDIVNG